MGCCHGIAGVRARSLPILLTGNGAGRVLEGLPHSPFPHSPRAAPQGLFHSRENCPGQATGWLVHSGCCWGVEDHRQEGKAQ
jgi:hypothetical protein